MDSYSSEITVEGPRTIPLMAGAEDKHKGIINAGLAVENHKYINGNLVQFVSTRN